MNHQELEATLARIEQRLTCWETGRPSGGATPADGGSQTEAPGRSIGHCACPDVPEREYSSDVSPRRLELIRINSKKWVNGTVLHYYFFDRATAGPWVPSSWLAGDDQKDVVREAFRTWKGLGIGLDFKEVHNPGDAEVKISFDHDDGSWSYVGRDVIDYGSGASEQTMNFGWDLTTPYGRDTALHEIGHTLGFPHEHQSPKAGIEWDEEAVYEYFAGYPNYWSRSKTRRNVIDKIPLSEVSGSDWDPNSIMHYEFQAGLIRKPERYQTEHLIPARGLSESDISEVRGFYPRDDGSYPEMRPFEVKLLDLGPGDQANFSILPTSTRWYDFRTFGQSDTVMVLFEDESGELRYRTGDDDSGTNLNAAFSYKLISGRSYVLRIRLYWSDARGEAAVMMW